MVEGSSDSEKRGSKSSCTNPNTFIIFHSCTRANINGEVSVIITGAQEKKEHFQTGYLKKRECLTLNIASDKNMKKDSESSSIEGCVEWPCDSDKTPLRDNEESCGGKDISLCKEDHLKAVLEAAHHNCLKIHWGERGDSYLFFTISYRCKSFNFHWQQVCVLFMQVNLEQGSFLLKIDLIFMMRKRECVFRLIC